MGIVKSLNSLLKGLMKTNSSLQEKNPRNSRGETPLHYAAENGHFEVCKLIIEWVDDKSPRNDNGITPLQKAKSKGHLEIYRFIMEKIEH